MADEVHVTVGEMRSAIRGALTRSGLSPEAAEHTADSLSEAECCGKRTQGLIRVENICAETARRRPDQVRVDREGESFLALMLQLFCGPLALAPPLPARGSNYGLCFLQIRPDLFHGGETAETGVKQILGAILECAPAAGHESMRLPGRDSHLALERAGARGLEVDRRLWERVGELAGR